MTGKEKNVIRETDDEAQALAQDLVRTGRYGALAAFESGSGHPFASRVAFCPAIDGTPVMLISELSEHTRSVQSDPRCSLLVGETGTGDPLAYPRITLIGRAKKIERDDPEREQVRARYLARHPKAALYADFGDFAFYAIEIERASLNGGFGKAYHLTRDDLILSPVPEGLAEMEAGAVEHMNDDHEDAVALYARVFAKRAEEGGWRLISFDPEGYEIARKDEIIRLKFPQPLQSASDLRTAFVDLVKKARAG